MSCPNICNEMPERPHDPLPEIYQKIRPLNDEEMQRLASCRCNHSVMGSEEWALLTRAFYHYCALRGREHLIP